MISRDRRSPLRAVACRDGGQTTAEYALVLGLVMVAAVLAFTALGDACVRLLEPVVKAVAR
jgi:Flp pilus assembly pilin Flp